MKYAYKDSPLCLYQNVEILMRKEIDYSDISSPMIFDTYPKVPKKVMADQSSNKYGHLFIENGA